MRREKVFSGFRRISDEAGAYLMRMKLKKKTVLFVLGTFAGLFCLPSLSLALPMDRCGNGP